jgi:pimeloyl-ACP methyl ester carboxylesterase
MKNFFKKLQYGARVMLSQRGGEAETISLPGRETVVRHGGDGPPLVYLHSSLGEGAMWLPFMQTWAKSHHLFVPLHPGFGASGGFDQIDSIDDVAFHYAELFDALGLDDFILGGHSLGGWIAAEYAVRWPERVRKLWISGAPGLWVDEQPLPDLFRIMQDRDKMRELLFYDPAGPMSQLVIQDHPDDEKLKFGFQAMTVLARLVWRRPYNPRLAARLHRIQCPTLLLWGDHDRLVPPAYGEAYRKGMPHAEFALLPKCGHLPMFETENEYVERVLRFARANS